MEQYMEFRKADSEKGMLHAQVGTRMIALRMSSCLLDIGLRQDNVQEVIKRMHDSIKEVAKWYDDFLNEEQK